MSTQFVAHVLSYSLGRGNLSLKGKRKRPWLEISRCETERPYLNFQLQNLRQLHDGKLDIYKDRLATNGFYDRERFRIHGEGLWRAYELLCPRDSSIISRQVLDIAGLNGLASLWIDQGRIIGKKGAIRGRYTEKEYEVLTHWINDFGLSVVLHKNQMSTICISFKKTSLEKLKNLIQPHIHQSMRKKLP